MPAGVTELVMIGKLIPARGRSKATFSERNPTMLGKVQAISG